MTRTRHAAATCGWFTLLIAAGWTSARMGSDTPSPGWSSPGEWIDWAARQDPVDVVVAVARPVGIGLVAYLLLVSVAQLLPTRRGGRVRSGLRRITPGVVLTLTAGLAAASPVAAQHGDPTPAPSGGPGRGATMELIVPGSEPATAPRTRLPWTDSIPEHPPATSAPAIAPTTSAIAPTTSAPPAPMSAPTATTPPATTQATAPPTMTPTTAPSTTSPARASTAGVPPTATSTTAPSAPAPARAATTPEAIAEASHGAALPDPGQWADAAPLVASPERLHVVEPGDHLWSIAEQVLTAEGSPTDERAVATYWRILVEENRDRLVDPEDPDLIFPGQELVLPAS
ncbi:MAG: LysM peptidoglycan-binding domain-containing protein [Microthrixaceae bacterium]